MNMLYSIQDKQTLRGQIAGRVSLAAAMFLVPFIIGLILMYTVRIEWLSLLLSLLGMAGAVFYYGLCVSPFISYHKFLTEILNGRSREFTGPLLREESGSVRDGVSCRTLYFGDLEHEGEERLCYLDVEKEYAFEEGRIYRLTTHGQSIIGIEAV